jgi:hypothetical protein
MCDAPSIIDMGVRHTGTVRRIFAVGGTCGCIVLTIATDIAGMNMCAASSEGISQLAGTIASAGADPTHMVAPAIGIFDGRFLRTSQE